MDHLPKLQHPFECNTYVDVPYLTPAGQHKFAYSPSTGFLEFPGKSGFDPLQWAVHNDLQGESFLDVTTFYQSWCFFAFVVNFLRIGGVDAGADDFIRDGTILTTHRLHTFLLHFQDISRTLGDEQKRIRYRKLEDILEKVSTIAQSLSFPSDIRLQKPRPFLCTRRCRGGCRSRGPHSPPVCRLARRTARTCNSLLRAT